MVCASACCPKKTIPAEKRSPSPNRRTNGMAQCEACAERSIGSDTIGRRKANPVRDIMRTLLFNAFIMKRHPCLYIKRGRLFNFADIIILKRSVGITYTFPLSSHYTAVQDNTILKQRARGELSLRCFTTVQDNTILKPNACRHSSVACFTTVQDNTILKHIMGKSIAILRFTTVQDNTILKLTSRVGARRGSFTTVQDNTILKQDRVFCKRSKSFTTVQDNTILKPASRFVPECPGFTTVQDNTILKHQSLFED